MEVMRKVSAEVSGHVGGVFGKAQIARKKVRKWRDRSESLPFWHTVSQVLFRWVKSTGNDCSEIEHGPLKGSRQTAYVRYVVRCVLYMCRRGDSLREVMSAS